MRYGAHQAPTFPALLALQKAAANGDTGDYKKQREHLTELGEGRRVQLKAYVFQARQEGGEGVNCGHDFDSEGEKDLFHDIHIALVPAKSKAMLPGAANKATNNTHECQGIVAEMAPHHRPAGWTEDAVNAIASAKVPVRVTGQLFYDASHVPCDGTTPVGSNPKRFSLWEIHPIYKFEVCTSNCTAAGHEKWVTLEQWTAHH